MKHDLITADWMLSGIDAPLKTAGVRLNSETRTILETSMLPSEERTLAGTTFLTPGLVNGHCHLELHEEAPIAIEPGEDMADWILKVVGRNRGWSDSDRRKNCQAGVLEMIRTGTTCVNDITSSGVSAEVLAQIGMRGIVSPEWFYPFHSDVPDVSEIIERFKTLKKRFVGDELLTIGTSPHSLYNVTLQAIDAVLNEIDTLVIHSHLAETQEEIAWFKEGNSNLDKVHEALLGKKFGPVEKATSPLQLIQHLIDARWIFAHGVFLSEEDWQTLAQAQASIVSCPRSNLAISGQTLPDYRGLINTGVSIGIGTDSRMSCPDLDLRAEGRVAKKEFGLSDAETFKLLTHDTAKAIKQENKLGLLEPGYQADMVLWHHPAQDIEDPYKAWLSPKTKAIGVWINGRIVLECDEPASLALGG